MEWTQSWYQVRNNKLPYILQQLKYSLQRCPEFMQPCPVLHLTINIQTQIYDSSVRGTISLHKFKLFPVCLINNKSLLK